tara:strand:- start:461 stop:574 length:114 start_codon:yes stop_codon:yes gene_type:complete
MEAKESDRWDFPQHMPILLSAAEEEAGLAEEIIGTPA